MPTLYLDDRHGRKFPLKTDGEIIVGSANGSDICLNDQTVSRRHAVIKHSGGRYDLADFNSTNGTFVNDRRVIGSATLHDRDVLQFGDSRLTLVSAPGRARDTVLLSKGSLSWSRSEPGASC